MKYILTLLVLFSLAAQAQNELKFNQRLIDCEDKWIILPMNKDSTYNFGFVYIDKTAGLTLNVEGTLKISADGKYVPKKITNAMLKNRIPPTKVLAAIILPNKYEELQIKTVPDWLAVYKEGGEDIHYLFRRGFIYNQWDEASKALPYLEKVRKLNPKYSGLNYEFAFAYNVLKQYDKAVTVLQEAIKASPNDCMLYKELVYAQLNTKLTDAENTFNEAEKCCTDKLSKAEMAHNIAYHYYLLKNKTKFNYWAEQVTNSTEPKDEYAQKVKLMQAEMNKL